jgi:transposase-like protein
LALVVLSMVEQRLDAVRAVLAGADVTEMAASIGVHRSTVHRWVGRYLSEHYLTRIKHQVGLDIAAVLGCSISAVQSRVFKYPGQWTVVPHLAVQGSVRV